MVTKLDKTLKREIELNGMLYVLTFSPEGLKAVEKGKRKGVEVTWSDLISGKAALTGALRDSVAMAKDRDD
jgi:hypothetical protein